VELRFDPTVGQNHLKPAADLPVVVRAQEEVEEYHAGEFHRQICIRKWISVLLPRSTQSFKSIAIMGFAVGNRSDTFCKSFAVDNGFSNSQPKHYSKKRTNELKSLISPFLGIGTLGVNRTRDTRIRK